MILTLQEDGVLYVYESPEEAVRAIEPLDAQETLRATYDDNGQEHVIEWVRPNRQSGSLLGLLSTVENGEYRLVPSNRFDCAGLLLCIRRASDIVPHEKRRLVQELVDRLTA